MFLLGQYKNEPEPNQAAELTPAIIRATDRTVGWLEGPSGPLSVSADSLSSSGSVGSVWTRPSSRTEGQSSAVLSSYLQYQYLDVFIVLLKSSASFIVTLLGRTLDSSAEFLNVPPSWRPQNASFSLVFLWLPTNQRKSAYRHLLYRSVSLQYQIKAFSS